MLDNALLKGHRDKKMVTPAARREAVAHLLHETEVSQRQVCRAIGAEPTSIRPRRRTLPQPDGVFAAQVRCDALNAAIRGGSLLG